MHREVRKRPAVEPTSALFSRDGTDPSPQKRPGSIISGSTLVLLRALSAVPWMISLFTSRGSIAEEYGISVGDANIIIGIGIGIEGVWMLMLLVLYWLVWRGGDRARMLVLFGATLSILSTAVTYFAAGAQLAVKTTLLTLALDILILLALSSRDARTWSRGKRRDRRRRRRAAAAALRA